MADSSLADSLIDPTRPATSWSDIGKPRPDADANPTWGDYGTVAKAGTKELGASVAAGTEYLAEPGEGDGPNIVNSMSRYLRGYLGRSADKDIAELTPVARERLESTLTSPEFWNHPLSALALKQTRMAPQYAAALVPAGLAIKGAEAAGLMAAGVSGTLNSAQAIQGFYDVVDKASDKELRESSFYNDLRDMGMSEDAARARLTAKLRGNEPLINFVVGSVAGIFGPEAMAARGLKGGVAAIGAEGKGLLGRVGTGMAEGAIGGGVEEGVQNVGQQKGAIREGLQKTFDTDAMVNAVLEGGVLEATMGAPAAAISRGHGAKTTAQAKSPEEVNQQIKGPGTGNQAPPPEDVDVGQPVADKTQNGGPAEGYTPGGEQYPKANAAKKTSKRKMSDAEKVVQDKLAEVTADQRVALDGETGTVAPSPQDVMAAAVEANVAQQQAQQEAVQQVVPETVPEIASEAIPQQQATPLEPQPGGLAVPATSPDTVAASRGAVPEVTPTVTPPGAEPSTVAAQPRVLEDQSAASKQAMAATNRVLDKNVKAAVAEPKAKEPKTNYVVKEKAARDFRDQVAESLFQKHTPVAGESDEGTVARAKAMVEEATAELAKLANPDAKPTAKILAWAKVPTILRGEQSAALTTLAEANALVKAYSGKMGPKMRAERLARFRTREEAARTGKVAEVLSERRVEGDLAKRHDQGDVETKLAQSPEEQIIESQDEDITEGGKLAGTKRELAPGEARAIEAARRVTERVAQAKKEIKPQVIPQEPSYQAVTTRVTPVVVKAGERVKHPKAAELAAKLAAKRAPAVTTATKIDQAAAKTETDLTEAQKKSGNYEKGKVEVTPGVTVAIETPRGELREGKDDNGKPWIVKMPDHYGEIQGTRGGDGDKVDAYIGTDPTSQHVFVLDQNNLDGTFDEHKVMLHYRDARDALAAYEKAFSDGKALDRLGSIKAMTMDEFKAWLKDRKATARPTEELIPENPAKFNIKNAVTATRQAVGMSHEFSVRAQGAKNEMAVALQSTTVRSALRSMILQKIGGPLATHLDGLIARRIINAAGDVPVRIISHDEMIRITAEDPRTKRGQIASGFYDHVNNQIVMDEVTAASPEFARILLHEAVHAATSRQINFGHGGNMIRVLMDTVAEADAELRHEYGFYNEHEFLAEAISNPAFQDRLANITLDQKMADALGMKKWQASSVWDAVVQTIAKILGLPKNTWTALDGALRLSEHVMDQKLTEQNNKSIARWQSQWHTNLKDAVLDLASAKVRQAIQGAPKQAQKGRPWALLARTTDQIAQAAENYFPGNNPVRVVADTMERIRTLAMRKLEDSAPIITKLSTLQKKYNGEVWDKFAEFVHDSTVAKVWGDVPLTASKNEHLGKDRLDTAWAKAQHAELSKAYRSLPEDLKQAWHEGVKYYADQQNQQTLGLINNGVLKGLGVRDPALAQRIFDDATTPADEALLGKDMLDHIKEANELSKIKGPYFPLMRRGDHVVSATLKIAVPTGATQVGDNVFEFAGKDARNKALEYAKHADLETDISSVWVDKNTGLREHPDGTRVSMHDADAEQRFRATVQNRHVEFFDGESEARRAAAAMEASGNFHEVKGVQVKQNERERNAGVSSAQMLTLMRSIQARKGYQNLTERERNNVVSALNAGSIRMMGSTRVQSRRLPRTNVLGASNDLVRNAYDYSLSSSSYLARLEHAPTLEKAMADMRKASDSEYGKEGSIGRSTIANEIEKRVDGSLFDESHGWHAWTKRLMTVSFLDKLFGPSHSIINATQPAMVSMPVLAGRHGVARAFTEMRRAYNDIGGLNVVKKGLAETYRKVKGGETAKYIDEIINRAAKTDGERAMFKHLLEVGSIDPESGLEIDQLIKDSKGVGGKIDTGLGYLEGIARQMPRAIEAMNRTSVALAAYRLEFAKTGDQAKAERYAQETVNNTQFLYSMTNRPKWFNHPLAKLTLQFKQYGQGMYHLLGMNIGKAIHSLDPAERKEAMKTLAGIAATHMALAGALGLPTEPFKYLLMGLQFAGITSFGWDDIEDQARRAGAAMFGKTAGEALTKGLPRLIGVDVSSRIGLDSLLSFGEPRSRKEEDVKKWLFDTIAGAPAGLVADVGKGLNAFTGGDFEKAAELLIPVKTVADSLRAYRQSTEGKKSATSGRQTMAPYTPTEALTRVLGFTPAREAETGAARANFYSKQNQAKDQRQALTAAWLDPKADKRGAWANIVKWNKGRPDAEQIKMSDLTSAAKRRATDERKAIIPGITTNKRDKHLLDNSPYVIQ